MLTDLASAGAPTKRAVKLQLGNGQPQQIAEAGVSGSEIIERNTKSGFALSSEYSPRFGVVEDDPSVISI